MIPRKATPRRLPSLKAQHHSSGDDLDLWLALVRVEGLGPSRLGRLLETLGPPAAVFGQSEARLNQACPFLPPQVARALAAGPDLPWARRQRQAASQIGAAILPFDHPDYPELLRRIPDPPPTLFHIGTFPPDPRPGVAVVGTRRPSSLGIQSCRNLVAAWARAGRHIVSGLAHGIDSVAHETCLAEGRATFAVLGNSLDDLPDGSRHDLAQRIAKHGALLSEIPFAEPAAAYTFARRNRILSGLVPATVVVEAGVHSGALLTARHALDQDRELLAVPGPAGWDSFAGCHRLLREGAALCAEPADLDPGCVLPPPADPRHPVARLLARGRALSVEELAENLGMTVPQLQVEVVQMELRGEVRRLLGGLVVRT